jgi:YfiH family protein
MSIDPDWIVPAWPAPERVRALVTTRRGGVSTGPYADLNLGTATGDDPAAVAQNRARLRTVLPQEPFWLQQQHGGEVVDADRASPLPRADASVALRTGTVCAILVADCIPVLLTCRSGEIVAAAHAGWRGVARGVLSNTVEAMRARGAQPDGLIAYLGPGIGRTAFEVGDDVVQACTARDPGAAHAFVRHREGKWLCDLFRLARRSLERCGVHEVYGGQWCTYSDPARFFSYRRDRTTGRMAALIWRTQ